MIKKTKAVTFEITDRKKFCIGMLLVFSGIWLPALLTVFNFKVIESLIKSLHMKDNSYLLVAALRLAGLNAIRCFPHYIGAFFVGEAVRISLRGKSHRWLSALLVAGLIVCVYRCIDIVHHIHYDFGVPALILVTLQVVLWSINYTYISPIKKMAMQMCFITAFQFLDVMPALNSLPFGRGETSQFVKQAAAVLDMKQLLNGMCLLFFTLFLLMGLMLLLTLRDENHLRQIAALKEQSEEIKTTALVQEQENRSYQEMQHLVHDLKSPLTAIQNLVGVMQYCCAGPGQEKEREYLTAMENLVSNMSQMISEILYQDSQTLLTTAALLSVVRSQVSVSPYAQQVVVENQAPDAQIRVNRIRMARAIINLLNNAYNALPEGKGTIHLTISRDRVQDMPVVRLEVADDGKGIPAEALPFIWKRGYSSHGSHGLGLIYVKSIVESSDGRVSIASQEEAGTVVTIDLPEGGGAENEK